MIRRGQGAFEYVLLLAGILLVAVIAVLILRSNVFPSVNNQIGSNQHAFGSVTCVKPWVRDPSSVIGAWHFDEGSGTQTLDATPGHEDGTLSCSVSGCSLPTWQAPSACKFGNSCLAYTETTPPTSSYVAFSTGSALKSILTNNKLTYSLWVKPSTGTGIQDMAGFAGYDGANNNWGYTLRLDPDGYSQLHATLIWKDSGNWISFTSQQIIPLNKWSYVAAKYDASAGKGGFVINGNPESFSSSSTPKNEPFGVFSSGIIGWATPTASIDELVVYNRALSDQELADDYSCQGA